MLIPLLWGDVIIHTGITVLIRTRTSDGNCGSKTMRRISEGGWRRVTGDPEGVYLAHYLMVVPLQIAEDRLRRRQGYVPREACLAADFKTVEFRITFSIPHA